MSYGFIDVTVNQIYYTIYSDFLFSRLQTEKIEQELNDWYNINHSTPHPVTGEMRPPCPIKVEHDCESLTFYIDSKSDFEFEGADLHLLTTFVEGLCSGSPHYSLPTYSTLLEWEAWREGTIEFEGLTVNELIEELKRFPEIEAIALDPVDYGTVLEVMVSTFKRTLGFLPLKEQTEELMGAVMAHKLTN